MTSVLFWTTKKDSWKWPKQRVAENDWKCWLWDNVFECLPVFCSNGSKANIATYWFIVPLCFCLQDVEINGMKHKNCDEQCISAAQTLEQAVELRSSIAFQSGASRLEGILVRVGKLLSSSFLTRWEFFLQLFQLLKITTQKWHDSSWGSHMQQEAPRQLFEDQGQSQHKRKDTFWFTSLYFNWTFYGSSQGRNHHLRSEGDLEWLIEGFIVRSS